MSSALSRLSNDRLLSRLEELVLSERHTTLTIIDHLLEVERRELFLELGYGSMFSYCTEHLGYSASGASRRIRTARCVRRFPVVREWLWDRRVNLTTVSMVAGILTDSNHDDMLRWIAGRTQREVEALLAEYRPRGVVRDRVTPICVVPAALSQPGPDNRSLRCDYNQNGRKPADRASDADEEAVDSPPGTKSKPKDPTPERAPASSVPASGTTEKQFLVRFAAAPGLMAQIRAARSLLSFRLPANASLADILTAVLVDFVERYDPSRRRERRASQRTSRQNERHTGASERPAEVPADEAAQQPMETAATRSNPRAIPAAIRDEVLAASGGRCQYVSESGRRCDGTIHLQVDHIVPVARGGSGQRENLRVLCAKHNRWEAKQLRGGVA